MTAADRDAAFREAQAAVVATISGALKTSQPHGLGKQEEGETNGNKLGVHSGRTRQVAEGPDGRGLHTGSGVLDRSGSDSACGRTDGPDRKPALVEPTQAGREPAWVATLRPEGGKS